jgi:hypothetical protein
MHFDSKKASLVLMAITAAGCSRALFAFFHDPEGPNLLVVVGMAAIIYLISLAVYLPKLSLSLTVFQRVLAGIFVQIFVAAAFYLALR